MHSETCEIAPTNVYKWRVSVVQHNTTYSNTGNFHVYIVKDEVQGQESRMSV